MRICAGVAETPVALSAPQAASPASVVTRTAREAPVRMDSFIRHVP